MELALSILGIAISLAIAWSEHRKAKRAEARLEALAANLPETLLKGVREVLAKVSATGDPASSEWAEPGTKADSSPWIRTKYADLDGDGTDELLVEVTSGPHSTTLLVYQLRDWNFSKLAELSSTTINGFDIQDSDGGGVLEVETIEVAKRPELPYAFGLRDRVTHRLIEGQFMEVARVEGWDDDDVQRARGKSSLPTDA